MFDKNYFTSDIGAHCRLGSNFGKSSNYNSVLRCYRTSEGFRLVGFNTISASTSVSLYFFLKSTAAVTNSNIQVDIFGKYEDNTTRISLSGVGSLTTTSGSVPSVLYRYEQVTEPYLASVYTTNYYEIEGSFNLRKTNMTAPYWLYFDEPSWTVYGNRRLLIKENSTSVEGWTELYGQATGSYYRYIFPTNYHTTLSATVNKQFLFRYTTQYAAS